MKSPVPTIGHCALSLLLFGSAEGSRLTDRLNAVHMDFLENRRDALSSLTDPFGVPEAARVVLEDPSENFRREAAWKRNVIATVFWIGEQPAGNNFTPNDVSAWDPNWQTNFGGYDDPNNRSGFLPADFIPALNPFYAALPYNDIGEDFRHRPEASRGNPMVLGTLPGRGHFCMQRALDCNPS